jgi:hypothetical protein
LLNSSHHIRATITPIHLFVVFDVELLGEFTVLASHLFSLSFLEV